MSFGGEESKREQAVFLLYATDYNEVLDMPRDAQHEVCNVLEGSDHPCSANRAGPGFSESSTYTTALIPDIRR